MAETPHWPIIVHTSLEHSNLGTILSQTQHKIRYVYSIVPGTCVFPLSALAFMTLPLQEATEHWPPLAEISLKTHVRQSLDRLVQVHRNCFVLCLAAMHGEPEAAVLAHIQKCYLNSQLSLLPVHNSKEAVDSMLKIAEMTCKSRMKEVKQELEKYQKEALSDTTMLALLMQTGLSRHDSQIVQDGLHSIGKVIQATKEELIDCTLDSTSADEVMKFFDKDEMI